MIIYEIHSISEIETFLNIKSNKKWKMKNEKWKMKNEKRNIHKNKKCQPKKHNLINKQKIDGTL